MCLPGTVETVRARADAEGVRLDLGAALLAGAGAALSAALPSRARAATTPTNRLVDLTHVYSEDFPLFLGAPVQTTREVVVTVVPDGFYAQKGSFWEHSGTHMDAPGHFIVVDISARVPGDADALVMPSDLVAFERGHGRIPKGALVAMYSGWESRAGSVAAYQNVGPDGLQHFPGFSPEAVEWLLENRDFTGIAVDTMSLDHGRSTTFDTHLTLLGANKYGLENIRNHSNIPARGATAYVGLIPWKEGSGGPCRVIARW